MKVSVEQERFSVIVDLPANNDGKFLRGEMDRYRMNTLNFLVCVLGLGSVDRKLVQMVYSWAKKCLGSITCSPD